MNAWAFLACDHVWKYGNSPLAEHRKALYPKVAQALWGLPTYEQFAGQPAAFLTQRMAENISK